jgi:hypothetical protein
MTAIAIGGTAFAIVFGGALLGMFLRAVLPGHHLSSDSKDIIRIAMAMIATLAAVVAALLIASAKSSFDSKSNALARAATSYVLLDRTLAEYGPETKAIRDQLHDIAVMRLHQLWPEEKAGTINPEAVLRGLGIEAIQRQVLGLTARNDAQQWLKSRALQLTSDITETRWAAAESLGSSIQWPLLTIMVFWFAAIFASFGLFAPANGSVVAALFACALSVAGSVYLIVEMDQPYGGLIRLSSAPLVTAIGELGQP